MHVTEGLGQTPAMLHSQVTSYQPSHTVVPVGKMHASVQPAACTLDVSN